MAYLFDENKYADDGSFSSAGSAYANKGFSVGFYHIPQNESIYFKAFITSFAEVYNSSWSFEQVFGRADGIPNFKSTSRRITLGFKVLATTRGEAYENLAKAQRLAQYLYPNYEDPNNATSMVQSSLVRLKVMNLVQRTGVGGVTTGDPNSIFNSYKALEGAFNGVAGVISSVTVNFNVAGDDGTVVEKANGTGLADGTVLPLYMDISVEFSPIHERTLGWFKEGESAFFVTPTYPYHAALEGDSGQELSDFSSASSATVASSSEAQDAAAGSITPPIEDDGEGSGESNSDGTLVDSIAATANSETVGITPSDAATTTIAEAEDALEVTSVSVDVDYVNQGKFESDPNEFNFLDDPDDYDSFDEQSNPDSIYYPITSKASQYSDLYKNP